jgi:hypothetical protein
MGVACADVNFKTYQESFVTQLLFCPVYFTLGRVGCMRQK